MIEIFSEERVFEKSANVETTLYDGFFSPADKNNMAILRSLAPNELANHGLKFADPRIEKLLFHYRARHYPDSLNRAEQIRWQKYCEQQIEQQAEQFSHSLNEMFQQHHDDPNKVKLLEDLSAYATQLSEQPRFSYQESEGAVALVNALNQVAEQSSDKEAKFAALNAILGKNN